MQSAAIADRLSRELADVSGVPRARLARVIDGAIRSAHDAHGPIDGRNASSVAKRAVSQLRADGLWRIAGGRFG